MDKYKSEEATEKEKSRENPFLLSATSHLYFRGDVKAPERSLKVERSTNRTLEMFQEISEREV